MVLLRCLELQHEVEFYWYRITKTLEAEGLSLLETIIKGSKDRLSPILMTALTAGLALIPLAISDDLPGNEIQSPMAKVILGGLISSTLP